jgi:hypothetical protein
LVLVLVNTFFFARNWNFRFFVDGFSARHGGKFVYFVAGCHPARRGSDVSDDFEQISDSTIIFLARHCFICAPMRAQIPACQFLVLGSDSFFDLVVGNDGQCCSARAWYDRGPRAKEQVANSGAPGVTEQLPNRVDSGVAC